MTNRPEPRTDRFRPTRCGVINLWDYRDEEFVFADGRMVLRGPNGSGKTKALEVLFPFVLDGRIEPRRLNPFAGDERTMKSNLLYRGQESAHGYVWMEFRRDTGTDPAALSDRMDADPPAPPDRVAAEIVTVGAGLRAQRHNDKVTRWYFVVDGQVGRDFSLLGADDRPLTRRQLAAGVSALRAVVTDRPSEHRTAVDARLFGLGLGRYEQLITLMLTLRRPQLAKNLDPKGLSKALADGLRPLDEGLIDEAAHSFSDMENVQRTLTGLVQADTAAAAFLSGYTTYVRTHARAEGDRVAGRLAAVEDARVALAGALAARDRSAAARDQAQTEHTATRDALRDITARLESLKSSPAYRDREQLTRLSELTADLGQAADRDRRATAQTQADVDHRRRALADASAAQEQAVALVTRQSKALTDAAADAGIDWTADDHADDGGLTQRVSARVTAREDDIAAVRSAIAAVIEAGQQRTQAERQLDRAEQRLAAAQQALAAAEAAVEAAGATLSADLDRWLAEHAATLDGLADGLGDTARGTLIAAAAAAADPTADAGSLPTMLDGVVADARQAARDDAARHRETMRQLGEQLDALRRDRDLIADEKDQAPPPFAARTSSREGRAGAPLWALVDFADGVDQRRAAEVEAALEAANLLDAWVPAGDAPVDPGESDTVLVPLPAAQRPKPSVLRTLLIAESGAVVPARRIEAVLASIGVVDRLDERPASRLTAAPAIGPGGGFRQGIQLGAHGKPHAEYIGATARARRRAERLAELDRQIERTQSAVDAAAASVRSIEGLLAAVEAARSALPATGPLLRAVRAVERAAAAVGAVADEVDHARSDLDQATAAHAARSQALLSTAAQRSLPSSAEGVDGVAAAVVLVTRFAHELESARRIARERATALAAADVELAQARDRLDEAAEQAERSRGEHQRRVEELRTLRDAVGVSVDELDRLIEHTHDQRQAAEHAEQQAQQVVERAIEEAGQRKGAVDGAATALTSAIVEAQQDCMRLRPYARADLRDVLRLPGQAPSWPLGGEQWVSAEELTTGALVELHADPDRRVEALPPSVLGLHRSILAATAELRPNESSLKSSRTRVSASLGELQDQLAAAGHDYRPDWVPVDDVIVVTVSDEQGLSSIGEFARRISAARRDQEALLSESEQRILEDALLGRLAQQIHERTTDARDLIHEMNREMRGRRMSSGATVGISWELADGLTPEQRTVSRLLDREASQLNGDDLAVMRSHFARQIKDLRAARPDRPYPEILGEALDYRAWRAFMLTLVSPGGTEERLTQARHSTLSGGEQSVSLHLPLFAAAHVMLSSAAGNCPRLLALDEAFAGIDDAGRSELLGLTAQFDLDLFMTGYDLWATYATVPGCAHHDLAHSAVEHAVSSLLLVWDGSKILTDAQIADADSDLAAALGSPGTRRRPGSDDGGEGLPDLE